MHDAKTADVARQAWTINRFVTFKVKIAFPNFGKIKKNQYNIILIKYDKVDKLMYNSQVPFTFYRFRSLAVWLLQNSKNVERNLLFFAIKSDKVDSLISIFASCK